MDASRKIIISFLIIIINWFRVCSAIYGTKIIILLFWFRARAPAPSAHEAPGPRSPARSPVRRSARAAVRGPGAVQFVLGEQGRRSSGPCGTRCPALALAAPSTPTGRSAARQLFFLGFQTKKFLQSIFFQSGHEKHQNRSGSARSYLAPAVRCGKGWPSDCRGAVQQLPAESWEVMRSVRRSITSTKHMAHLL